VLKAAAGQAVHKVFAWNTQEQVAYRVSYVWSQQAASRVSYVQMVALPVRPNVAHTGGYLLLLNGGSRVTGTFKIAHARWTRGTNSRIAPGPRFGALIRTASLSERRTQTRAGY
jgi:hypothetical protein